MRWAQKNWGNFLRAYDGDPLLNVCLTPQPLGIEGALHCCSDSGLSISGMSLDIILESEPQTLTVLVGESATFHCNLAGGELKNYQMSWYKKNEDNSLIFINNSNSKDDLKRKINTSKNQFALDIQRATVEDAGTYYCGLNSHCALVPSLTDSKTLWST